ncbi:MAG: hypothetical protein KF829_08645, partial [Ferruginibacter sp.]|nr:hypothetical protein [Ferruginibacter sp.]
MKNYYFLLKGLLCFLFLGLFSSALHAQEKIIQVGAGEYLTTYRTNLGNLYVTRWGGGARPILHNYGLTNVIDVDGAQYSNVCLTAAGNVYVVGVTVSGSPYTTLVPTDNLGNPFKNNSKVYGFYQSYLTLRNGTVWYWGTDDVLNMNNGSAVPAPIQLIQPAGKTMVKLVPASSTTFAGSATLWGLASDGTVWQWNRNSRSPSQVNFPGNIARDITMIGPMSYVIETATDLLAWGYDPSYAGGRPAWQQPGIQSVKAAWVNAGCVFPLKEFVGNYNTLHVIDANDNMFASGANPQGNIGNGIQTNPWKNVTLPWNWDWYNGQLMTPPTQVPGKFKNICTSNTITFYLYVQDMGDDWYSWGRNKALCLGNGKTLSVDDMAIYPEALNVPAPTLVTPLSQAWTVLPFNPNGQQPPLSHAGVNQYISSNTTTLYGSGSSQQDGSIVNFSWVKTSGPAATIVSPNAMNTQVTGLTSGTYIFSLTITNNYGVQHTSTVKVVVGSGAPANQPPVANAGNNQTITLPTNSVLLSGSGSDGDGTISMIQWSKISGPAQGNFASANSFSTRVNNLVQGVYSLQLEVTDNNGAKGRDTVVVTVLPAPNQAPVVITSSDISITLPVNEAPLEATITDADGSIVSILWTLVSGGAAVIDDPNAESTTVSGLEPGLYTFALTATDDDGATGSDTLLILVNTPVNQAPMAIAGPNQAVTSAVGSVTLNGDGYDPDGMISSMQWRKVQGGAATIQNPASGVTNVSNLAVDVYKFELTVTDDMGASARDTMQLTVTQAPNQPPVANAGPDISITLPINYVSITGNGTDPDGTITSYLWSKLSGPSATISNAFSPTVNITNMVQGLYVFRLRVTDNDGVSSTDNVVIVVEPAPNQMPVAHAGTDITITLPTNSVTLNGAGTDSDGTIVSYSWENISGPSAPSIASSNSASTVVNNFVEGHYIFKLTITDDRGGTATDEVDVIVLRAPNQAPTANAGPDQIITLPINYTALNGIGTDVDGSIVSYRWSKVSGPFATIANVASRNTNVSGLLEGTYVFQLKVTDNEGAIGTDQVTVVVQPQPNQAPVVSSGNDITITLPVNYVNLSATASDPDGVINSYQWTKISGGAASIVSPLSASTRVNGLAQGSYTFRIRVIDNLGDEAYDDIDVTVLPQPNQAPTANAGSDITITLPQNATTLNGSGSDVDGTISSYGWAQLSGPST